MNDAVRLPRLLDAVETARILRVAPRTLERMRARGEIRSRKIGGRVRYTEDDIRGCIERAACAGDASGKALDDIKSGFRRVRDRAGLGADVVPYTLRHTMASEMARAGVPAWEIAAWMGHASGYRTTDRYIKFGPDHLRQAARAIEAYFTELSAVASAESSSSTKSLRASSVSVGSDKVVGATGIEPVTPSMSTNRKRRVSND